MRSRAGFAALTVAGNLFSPEFLQTIAEQKAKHQAAADYGLTKSLALKDEIARYWRIASDLYASGSPQWLVAALRDVFGYHDLAVASAESYGERLFPITHEAFSGAVRFVLAPQDVQLDRADLQFADNGRGRAPQVLVQEVLNADPTRPWGIVSNGALLRLVRANPSLTRPAYVQADLQRIFEEQLYADFAALWLTIHATRLAPVDGKASGCVLEVWRLQAQDTGERALEHLREGVTDALRELANGFLEHPHNDNLRKRIQAGHLSADAFFQELLRLVYRLLFLFTAEDRGLLHERGATDDQRAIYRDAYSVARLRERALRRRHYDRHVDLWEGLRILFQCVNVGAPPLGLPALGGLFASEQSPMLDAALISNAALLEAVRALAYFRSGVALVRVNYRDMGTEELGSVYEGLLELHPYIEVAKIPWSLSFINENGTQTKGSARKLTGSYYTPASLVNEVIKAALEPVIARTIAENRSDPRSALLRIRILDPACGSGHFLLAAARRLAADIAVLEAGPDSPDEVARQHALREVVQHCIYGVDRNPLAVELCKTALWIETVEPGKPLSFLDPHVHCGDSLVGILDPSIMVDGIPDEAYTALAGDDKAVCRELKKRNRASLEAIQGNLFDQERLRAVSETGVTFEAMPEDTLGEVEAKRAAWNSVQSDARRREEEQRANLYVAAFFAQKTNDTASIVPINEDLKRLQQRMLPRPGIEALVQELARRHRFFHWHISFADIMQRGGFDVVLGNPPWKVAQLEEQEYFATIAPNIAALSGAERKKAISCLVTDDPKLWQRYEADFRASQAFNAFARNSKRYKLTAVGKFNLYGLFAETFLNLISSQGASGVILPTGIATDDSTKRFFSTIVSEHRLISLFSFYEIRLFFKATDSRGPFCLLTVGGDAILTTRPVLCFSLRDVSQLTEDERRVELTDADFKLLNPNTRTSPIFRSQADAALAKKIYERVPVLINESASSSVNSWQIDFLQGTFNMTSASGLFRTAQQLGNLGAVRDGMFWVSQGGESWVPLYEGKMIGQYDHRAGTFSGISKRPPPGASLPAPSLKDKSDPDFEVEPWYWVRREDLEARLVATDWKRDWLLGFVDVTNASNERTVLASIIPRVAANHKLPLVLTRVRTTEAVLLLANFNAIPLDYIARQKTAGMSLTYLYLKQFTILPPSMYDEHARRFITSRVLELTYTSCSTSPFASELGYHGRPFAWDTERRAWLRAELDAYYARLYGLTRDELRFMLDPGDLYGAAHPSETFRVLKEREIRECGDYRTARLVLRAWDEFERDAPAGLAAVTTA